MGSVPSPSMTWLSVTMVISSSSTLSGKLVNTCWTRRGMGSTDTAAAVSSGHTGGQRSRRRGERARKDGREGWSLVVYREMFSCSTMSTGLLVVFISVIIIRTVITVIVRISSFYDIYVSLRI